MRTPKLEQFAATTEPEKQKEPATTVGVYTSLATAVVVVLTTMFPKWMSEEVRTAVYGVLVIILPMIAGLLIRQKVWSPASVAQILDEQKKVIEGESKPFRPTSLKDYPKMPEGDANNL